MQFFKCSILYCTKLTFVRQNLAVQTNSLTVKNILNCTFNMIILHISYIRGFINPNIRKRKRIHSPAEVERGSGGYCRRERDAAARGKVSVVVVGYHVTIVAIGHGLLKKFWPMVIGCVQRTAGSSII